MKPMSFECQGFPGAVELMQVVSRLYDRFDSAV
jgi:hypothetical protein